MKLLKITVSLFALVAGIEAGAQTAPADHMTGQWDFLDSYCLQCHNFDDFAGGLSFEGMGPESLLTDGEHWEEVIMKLDAGMMPPVGQDTPSETERENFVLALETALDTVVEQQPRPGNVVLHRLNRTEYANAVEEILGVTVEASDLLPRDEENDGFDNAASVLNVSPSFLEQYILAARDVSVLAVGKPNAMATGAVYAGAPDASQNLHIDGLPLGTRGGMLIEHDFPADGEYQFTVSGLVGGGYVWGVMDRNTLIITIDDEEVFRSDVGDRDDLDAVDVEQAVGIERIDSRFRNISANVKAGRHRVGVTFIARSSAAQIEQLHGFNPVDGMGVLVQGVSGGPRISNVTIRGPFNPQGVSETASREKIFVCYPEQISEELACARRILSGIATRAFRRPVTDNDLQGAMDFYAAGRETGSFDDGIQKGIMAILASPKFLYRAHTPPEGTAPGESFLISDIDLASRLSYFLWSNIPDEELVQVASEGRLSDPEVLEEQVRRMLADPKASALVTNFAFQWLNVKGMEQIDPDATLFPQFTYDLVPDFEKELELFIGSIFNEDRPVVELLTADHTFLNERLSIHYGLNVVRGDQFQKVTLDDPQRFGLLGKGGILMATSYPNRTSPVIRGAYILEKLVGAHAPAPPPNVEAFPENEEGAEALTVRARLESHRDNPACRSCHAVIDPLGLSLENFNAIGQWRERDRDAGVTIDATGNLTDGRAVGSPLALSQALASDPERFAKTFTNRLMTFALGRGLEYYDMPVVRQIVREAADEDYNLSSIVLGIVNSDAFRRDVNVISDTETSEEQIATR